MTGVVDTYLLVDHFEGHKTLKGFRSRDDAIAAGQAQAETIAPGRYLTVWKLTPDGSVGVCELDIHPDGTVTSA